LAGFLPPNVTPPQGDAKLLYSVSPKSGLASGTTICNKATVVFDTNAPIQTPNWCNTLDSTPPVSHVQTLPATQTSSGFPVQWAGSDAGSGILDYTIYVSDNGQSYSAWLTYTTMTQASYTGLNGHSYGFYSIARDLAGNVEGAKLAAEGTTLVALPSAPTLDVDASVTATKYDALTDGLVIIRYLFGLTGTSLTSGALGGTATRSDPVAVKAYLDGIRTSLDIDGNGTADALTDGLLIIRYLFGLRGASLVAGAVDPLGSRKTATDIETYIQTLMP
jgi:hypothetical protein